jgi:hypothetical protein
MDFTGVGMAQFGKRTFSATRQQRLWLVKAMNAVRSL